jgi:hypothetical protein
MARSKITDTTIDLQSDSGGVLWSFVKGEQLEFPITLNFLTNAYGYTYEAVIMEADNVLGSDEIPINVKSGGVNTTLTVRVPIEKGTWNPASAYDREDVVLYSGTYYKLSSGTSRVSATIPSSDPLWVVYVPNKVYIQFPSTVGSTWTVQPTTQANVYGYFELRVTEPSGGVYQKTWKPMRGLVSLEFSPTDLVT